MTADAAPATSAPTPAAQPAGLAAPVGTGRLPAIVYALLVLLCVALYLPGFTAIPPFDRDEARFAQATRQMLDSGDLVDIRFQEEVRYKKPVGIYWLQAASTAVLSGDGAAIWTYRVPSLVGAVAAVLMTAWLGTRMFGSAVGAMAAVMLASCVVLGVEARMAKTDAVLLATVVAAQAALAVVYLGRHGPPPGRGVAVLFWVAVGVSALVKGPIIALVSGATAAGLALWERRAGWLLRLRPLLGLAIVLAIALPWFAAIAVKTGGTFFAESVGHDMLGKVAGGQEGKGLPPGYYLGTVWVTFAPWAFLVLLALPWVWTNHRDDRVRVLVAWIVPAWLVFELVPTKLLHYTLPVFPALAILAARAAADRFGRSAERPRRWLFAAAVGLGTLGFAALTVAVALVPWLVDRRLDWGALAQAVPVLALFALAVRFVARREEGRALVAGTAAALVLYAGTYAFVLPGIDGIWVSRSAARLVAEHRPCDGSVVASAGYSEPSLVFLLGTSTRLGGGGAAAEHLSADPACALALVESREEGAFRAALPGTPGALELGTVALGTVEGFNYNTGRRVWLTLYGAAPP